MPIYRQISDQIRFQIASGMLPAGQQVPSVRQLAGQLAVNQNTILKVYNELCRAGVLEVQRGNGTFVAVGAKQVGEDEKKNVVARALRDAAVQAVQFGMDKQQVHELLDQQFSVIESKEIREADQL
jgi:GntR family transcriptional regulator